MAIIYDNNKVYRNLQEQVGKNKDDIETLKSGIKISYWVPAVTDLSALMVEGNEGKYAIVGTTNPQHLYVLTKRSNEGWIADNLGEYPAVVKGSKGDTGDTGASGKRGTILDVSGWPLKSATAYEEGDMLLVIAGGHKGEIYRKDNGGWLLQCSVIGAQGPVGPTGAGTEVVANPSGSAQISLNKVKIEGVIYQIPETVYTAGTGIDITNKVISVDTDVISTVDYVDDEISDLKDYVDDELTTEGVARQNADTALGLRIDAKADQSALAAEISARQTADNNIRAVAEGKCKAYVLDTTDTTIDAGNIQYYDLSGNVIADPVSYVSGKTNKNAALAVQTAHVDINESSEYLILQWSYPTTTNSRTIIAGNDWFKPRIGDVFLIVQTDVPDRWIDGALRFWAFDSEKIDLTNLTVGNLTATGNISVAGNIYTNRIFPQAGETTYLLANTNIGTSGNNKNFDVYGNTSLHGSLDAGNVTLGTSSSPKNLYAHGNIETGGNTTVNGNLYTNYLLPRSNSDNVNVGTSLAPKNLNVYGAILTNTLSATNGDTVNIGTPSFNKNLNITGGLTIGGEYNLQNYSLYSNANGNVWIGTEQTNKNLEVYGDVTARSTLKANTIKPYSGSDVFIGSIADPKKLWTTAGAGLQGPTTIYGPLVFTANSRMSMSQGRIIGEVAQADFLENLASNISISEYSCYKIGQFIKVHMKLNLDSGSYSANTVIANIKTAYKPLYLNCSYNIFQQNWGAYTYIQTDGSLRAYNASTTAGAYCYLDLFYEIA